MSQRFGTEPDPDDGTACHERPFRLGPWSVDPDDSTIEGQGREIRIDRKAMHVLAFLVDHPGKTVTRQAIFDHVWPQKAVTDEVLTVAISTLRRALGDDAREPRFIRTVPTRGYRLLIEPSEVPEEPVAGAASAGPSPYARKVGYAAVGAVVAIIVLVSISALVLRGREAETTSDASGRASIESIAVLPFKDYSGPPSRLHIAAGMTEELITHLAKTELLSVTSRTTAQRYDSSDQTVAQIGRALGVDAILEGSVQVSEDELRLHVQLIDARTDRHLWAEDYDRPLEDLLRLQSELAATIIGRITDRAVAAPSLREAPRVDPRAFELYLKARFLRDQESIEGLTAAVSELERSLELAPDFAPAHATLAEVLFYQVELGLLPPAIGFSRGLEAAERALELDPDLAAAHAARAIGHFGSTWNLAEAGREFERALELGAPSLATLKWYVRYLVVTQRFERAVEVANRIEELDPTSYVNLSHVQALDCAGQHERALARLAEIESLFPELPGVHSTYAQIYMHLGRRDEAAKALLRLGEAVGWPAERLESLRSTFAADGADGIYRTFASASSPLPSPALRARFHALLGQDEEALRLLGESVAARDMNVLWIGADRSYDRLRSRPRFRELVRAVGLDRDS